MECPGFLALAKLGWTPRSAEKMHRFYTILGLASMIGPLQKQLIPRVAIVTYMVKSQWFTSSEYVLKFHGLFHSCDFQGFIITKKENIFAHSSVLTPGGWLYEVILSNILGSITIHWEISSWPASTKGRHESGFWTLLIHIPGIKLIPQTNLMKSTHIPMIWGWVKTFYYHMNGDLAIH